MKTGGTQRTPSSFIPADNIYFNPNKSDIFVFYFQIYAAKSFFLPDCKKKSPCRNVKLNAT